jgi:hypothetical protein
VQRYKPGHPAGGDQLDVVDAAPGFATANQFGLVGGIEGKHTDRGGPRLPLLYGLGCLCYMICREFGSAAPEVAKAPDVEQVQ